MAAPYLCEQDAALFLSYAWTSIEEPNNDPNLNKRSLVAMFHSIDPQKLMDEEEYELFQSLDNVVTVYRGVTSYNAENVEALSWSLNVLPTDTVKTAPYTRRRLKKEISMPYSWAGMKRK